MRSDSNAPQLILVEGEIAQLIVDYWAEVTTSPPNITYPYNYATIAGKCLVQEDLFETWKDVLNEESLNPRWTHVEYGEASDGVETFGLAVFSERESQADATFTPVPTNIPTPTEVILP